MSPIRRRSALALGAAAAAMPARAQGRVVVGTWGGDYADLLAQNVERPVLGPRGIEVLHDIAPQEPRKAKLIAERGSRRGSMDVACLSDIDMFTMSLANVWEPVTPETVPGAARVLPALRMPYGIPHIYSGKVILYNPDKVKPAPRSYAELWEPRFRGRVGLVDLLYLQIIETAAAVGGGSMDDYEPGKKKLLELKALEPRIYPSNEALAVALRGEEVWITIMWLARGHLWRQAGINVQHAVPEEGATPYISAAGVPRNAQNKANGFAYLDAMLDPAAQVRFAERMGYMATVADAPVPEALVRAIGFTPKQQERFRKPNYEYIARNTQQFLEFWNREFKA